MSASPRLSFYLRDCDARDVAALPVPLRWAAHVNAAQPLSRSCPARVQSFCLSDFGITPSAASTSRRALLHARDRLAAGVRRSGASAPAAARYFLSVRIQSTSFLMSASATCVFGGIGIGPQTPEPPFLTFFVQLGRRARRRPCTWRRRPCTTGPITFLSIGVARACSRPSSSCPRAASVERSVRGDGQRARRRATCDGDFHGELRRLAMAEMVPNRTGAFAARHDIVTRATHARVDAARFDAGERRHGGRHCVPRQTHAAAPSAGAAPLRNAAGASCCGEIDDRAGRADSASRVAAAMRAPSQDRRRATSVDGGDCSRSSAVSSVALRCRRARPAPARTDAPRARRRRRSAAPTRDVRA